MLRDGPRSPYARWFDVDWAVQDRAMLMPVLGGAGSARCSAAASSSLADGGPDGDEPVCATTTTSSRCGPGTEDLPLAELLDRQWYRLAYWRVGDEELNYRRFFDVDTLAARARRGPGGLRRDARAAARPGRARGRSTGCASTTRTGWPTRAATCAGSPSATGGAWVVVEKILEGDERLPDDWPCAGTTGYDRCWRVGGLFVDPAGEQPLTDQLAFVSGARLTLDEVVTASKQEVVGTAWSPEVLGWCAGSRRC